MFVVGCVLFVVRGVFLVRFGRCVIVVCRACVVGRCALLVVVRRFWLVVRRVLVVLVSCVAYWSLFGLCCLLFGACVCLVCVIRC